MKRLSPDEKWQRYNAQLVSLMQSRDFYGLGVIYQEMANFLMGEGKDKGSREMLEKAYEMKLIHHKQYINDLQKSSPACNGVEVSCAPDSCADCLKLSGKVFDFNSALKNNPLPVINCKHPSGCRCAYLPVVG